MGRFFKINIKATIFTIILLIPFLFWFGRQQSQFDQKYDGALYVGFEIPFYGIDVLGSGGVFTPEITSMAHLIMDRLFTYGPTGQPVPALGLSATPSDDGKSWDIVLRQGVKFHDGTRFNADAVVHHWKRILNPDSKFRGRSFFKPITDIVTIDEYTVRFILKHPWGAFLKVISDEIYTFAYIPSPKAVEELTHNEAPVGTGPFKFEKWNNGDHFSVVRNNEYWQEGKPYLDKIVFRHIPDAQTRYAALVSNQVDVIAVDRGTIIQKAMKGDTMAVYPSKGSGAEIVLVNMAKPPLDDIRVRQALALANNQKLQIKMVYQNTIPYVHHPFGAQIPCDGCFYPEHDLEKARQLIKDYGRPVEIECLHSNTLRGRNIGELLQQLYQKIGVKLTPLGLHPGNQVMRVVNKDFQLATWRILSTRDHGTGLVRSFNSQSTGNWTGYKSAKMDDLLELQQVEQNPYRRQEILCEIAGLLNTDVPFFYRGGRRFHVIAPGKIQGISFAGEMVDFSLAWIKGFKDNPWAKRNEKDAKSPVDCSDPGDVEVVKNAIQGAWRGKDMYGAILNAAFGPDDSVTSSRGEYKSTSKYKVCGSTIFWRPPGALLVVSLEGEELKGHWEYSGYTGKFTLKRLSQDQAKTK